MAPETQLSQDEESCQYEVRRHQTNLYFYSLQSCQKLRPRCAMKRECLALAAEPETVSSAASA